jgi:shikimate dehydrogenase
MDALSSISFAVEGKTALVIGSGGAARAVVFILNWLRTEKVLITGRDPQKVKRLVDTFGGEALPLDDLGRTRLTADILINTTSVSSPDEAPELADIVGSLDMPDCRLVLDLNYGRRSNFWQQLAQNRDIRFVDGLPALAYQARRTLALWTGMQVPPEEFLEALKNHD